MTANSNINSPNGPKYGPNAPFIVGQPFNLLSFLSVFSPIILVTLLCLILSSSNTKGFVYLGFIIGAVILRSIFLQAIGVEKNKDMCGVVRYTSYGNATFTTFIFGFPLMYLFLPMFNAGAINWMLLVFLLVYVFFDIGIKVMRGCIVMSRHLSYVIGDLVSGMLEWCNCSRYVCRRVRQVFVLRRYNVQRTICSMPKKQTFKCQVFKNGELVTSRNV